MLLSFTTDIWTSSICPRSVLSLTAQWTGDVYASLHHITSESFQGSHTRQAIVHVFKDILQIWGNSKSSVHIVLRVNAKKKKKKIRAMANAGVPSLSYNGHILQMVVHEQVLSQKCFWYCSSQSQNSWAFQMFCSSLLPPRTHPVTDQSAHKMAPARRTNLLE